MIDQKTRESETNLQISLNLDELYKQNSAIFKRLTLIGAIFLLILVIFTAFANLNAIIENIAPEIAIPFQVLNIACWILYICLVIFGSLFVSKGYVFQTLSSIQVGMIGGLLVGIFGLFLTESPSIGYGIVLGIVRGVLIGTIIGFASGKIGDGWASGVLGAIIGALVIMILAGLGFGFSIIATTPNIMILFLIFAIFTAIETILFIKPLFNYKVTFFSALFLSIVHFMDKNNTDGITYEEIWNDYEIREIYSRFEKYGMGRDLSFFIKDFKETPIVIEGFKKEANYFIQINSGKTYFFLDERIQRRERKEQ